MKLIKNYEYNPITPEPFEIPFPVYFELYYKDIQLATYRIADELWIDYTFDNTYGIPIITPEREPISIDDIYFLLTCRVFRKNYPGIVQELKLLGLNEYNPYYIVKKTHGLMQNDMYWIKFPGEDDVDSYEKAVENFQKLHIIESEANDGLQALYEKSFLL